MTPAARAIPSHEWGELVEEVVATMHNPLASVSGVVTSSCTIHTGTKQKGGSVKTLHTVDDRLGLNQARNFAGLGFNSQPK